MIRESSKSNSKTVAKDAERTGRRELEAAYNRIPKRERVPLFSRAAEVWLANKAGLAPRSKERYEQCVTHLKEQFGKGLVCDVDANDIADYRDLSRPMGSWRKAWRLACNTAGVQYRPHDMPHTFISRLAENPGVSEQTIKALAGHVNRQMLERYSRIRSAAKQAAIQAPEQDAIESPILRATGHKIGYSREFWVSKEVLTH